MRNLAEIKNAYLSGEMEKATFIQAMYGSHQKLFEYVDLLQDGKVSKIQIDHRHGVVFTLTDPEINMICPEGDARMVPVEALNFGHYEKTEWDVVRFVVRSLGGAAAKFLDIGANAGFYSLSLAREFPGIQGVAVEPVPAVYELLVDNLTLNDVQTVQTHNIGLSNEKGSFTFYSYPSQSAAASMARNFENIDAVEVTCRVETLDEFSTENGLEVDFIKCDVEGAEKLVFEGGLSLLQSQKPVVFAEMLRIWSANYDYHPNDMIRLFREIGYRCFALGEQDVRDIESVDAETVETNYLFLDEHTHQDLCQKLRTYGVKK